MTINNILQVEEGTITKNVFRRLFSGSELVVAGKLRDESKLNKIGVEATSLSGGQNYYFDPIPVPEFQIPIPPPEPTTNHTPSSMERLWAYLTIQQLLEQDATKDSDKNDTSSEKKRALELALKVR